MEGTTGAVSAEMQRPNNVKEEEEEEVQPNLGS
jgi:hypothetical protein